MEGTEVLSNFHSAPVLEELSNLCVRVRVFEFVALPTTYRGFVIFLLCIVRAPLCVEYEHLKAQMSIEELTKVSAFLCLVLQNFSREIDPGEMSLFKPACEEAYRKIFYDASLTWCLLGYEGKMVISILVVSGAKLYARQAFNSKALITVTSNRSTSTPLELVESVR